MSAEFVLYSYFRSSSTYRVRIALNYKEIKYDIKPIHLLKDGGQQKTADYKRVNPMGEVPCLFHNGNYLGQSMAIIEYLEEVKPNPSIFPKGPAEKAKVRQIAESINSGIQPIQNLKVLQKLQSDFSATEDQKTNWNRHWINEGFLAIEKILEQTSGTYSFGNNVTLADFYLVPQVFNAKRFGVDMLKFPNIDRINEACLKLEAFFKASPEQQIDFEKR